MTREDIKDFLIKQKDKSKEEVLANFSSWIIVNGFVVNKLGKMISDLRSYPEWKWGE